MADKLLFSPATLLPLLDGVLGRIAGGIKQEAITFLTYVHTYSHMITHTHICTHMHKNLFVCLRYTVHAIYRETQES